MKQRLFLLISAFLLASCLSVTSVAVTGRKTAPVEQAQASQLAQEAEYLLKSSAGTVCIYQNGAFLRDTGIPVQGLPAGDRERLSTGIPAADAGELAALLEDLDA